MDIHIWVNVASLARGSSSSALRGRISSRDLGIRCQLCYLTHPNKDVFQDLLTGEVFNS